MPSTNTIIFSLFGGILPALLWLWFWLHEDKKKPEPKKRILSSFVFGMIAVIVVLPIEKLFYNILGKSLGVEVLVTWSAIEEIVKFLAAYLAAIRFSDTDEPIDFVIYMVSAALGFSALENSFFLANLLGDGLVTQSIISGNMRFLGATLLHIITAATVGSFMAISFYKDHQTKKLSFGAGIMFAIVLHTLFNFFIIKTGSRVFFVFGTVWFFIIALIFMFEKIKSITPAVNSQDNIQ